MQFRHCVKKIKRTANKNADVDAQCARTFNFTTCCIFIGSSVSTLTTSLPHVERLYPPRQDVHPGAGGERGAGDMADGGARGSQGGTQQVPGHSMRTPTRRLLDESDRYLTGYTHSVRLQT